MTLHVPPASLWLFNAELNVKHKQAFEQCFTCLIFSPISSVLFFNGFHS